MIFSKLTDTHMISCCVEWRNVHSMANWVNEYKQREINKAQVQVMLTCFMSFSETFSLTYLYELEANSGNILTKFVQTWTWRQ